MSARLASRLLRAIVRDTCTLIGWWGDHRACKWANDTAEDDE